MLTTALLHPIRHALHYVSKTGTFILLIFSVLLWIFIVIIRTHSQFRAGNNRQMTLTIDLRVGILLLLLNIIKSNTCNVFLILKKMEPDANGID